MKRTLFYQIYRAYAIYLKNRRDSATKYMIKRLMEGCTKREGKNLQSKVDTLTFRFNAAAQKALRYK